METQISEDLIFCILLWLPVTTLLRFKSACRSWRSFIESPTFISQHVRHHHHYLDDQVDSWKLMVMDPFELCWIKGPANLEFCILSGNNFQFSHKLQFQLNSEQIQNRCTEGLPEIIACYHGIICLHFGYDDNRADEENFYSHDICLWNPATTESIILPPLPVPIPYFPYLHNPDRFSYGFGFDPQTNDYKVVRILIEEDNNLGYLHRASRFPNSRTDVYSLSTNSWRKVDLVSPVHTIESNPKVPFRDGIFCWLGLHQYRENGEVAVGNVIVSFDFTNEVFGTIPVPDVYHNCHYKHDVQYCSPALSYLRENIACIDFDYHSNQYDIWVSNQYGVNYSWTKLYAVTSTEDNVRPFCGISKNVKLFWIGIKEVWPSYPETLYLSDLVTQDFEILRADPNPPSPAIQVVVYKESLVSIKSAVGASATKSAICSEKPRPEQEEKKKKLKGQQGQRVRLYVKGTILAYKRSKSNQYPNTSLVQIEGVNTREEVAWYCGKKMAYIYKAKVEKNGSHYRCIWGKVTRPHGNNGVVRAKFKSNLPPKAMGMKVRIFMYPSNI